MPAPERKSKFEPSEFASVARQTPKRVDLVKKLRQTVDAPRERMQSRASR
jgi:hypothetical protein